MTHPRRLALALLVAGFAFRLVLAGWLPLAVDESYAVAMGRSLSASFFDHPPIGFWLPALMVHLTGIEHAFVYRLPYVAMGLVTGWALWRIGQILGGDRVGLLTVILWLLAPHMVLGSGMMVVPDAPMNMGLALAAVVLLGGMSPGQPVAARRWIVAGAWIAFALASKYQSGLFAVAVLAALALTPRWRGWLVSPWPWAAGAVAALGLVPVLLWNLQTDFASFRFHSGRSFGALDPGNLAVMSLAQLGFLLPPVAVIAALGLGHAFRASARDAARMLGFLAALPLLAFALVYLFGTSTYAHWTMSGWIFALPLGALWMAQAADRARIWAGRTLWGFGGVVWGVALLAALHLPTGLLTRGASPAPEWDRQIEMIALDEVAAALERGGQLNGISRIVALDWMQGGQIATALASRLPVQIAGADRRHFAFLPDVQATGPALGVILHHADAPAPDLAPLLAFAAAQGLTPQDLGHLTQTRGGQPHVTARLIALKP